MPEAAMYEYHRSVARKGQVGLAGQITTVKAVAVTHGMNETAHSHFRLAVSALDSAHAFGSFGAGKRVGHFSSVPRSIFGPVDVRPVPLHQGHCSLETRRHYARVNRCYFRCYRGLPPTNYFV